MLCLRVLAHQPWCPPLDRENVGDRNLTYLHLTANPRSRRETEIEIENEERAAG
jgi:hypothetical protein